MRLHRLHVTAFGPFAGTETVDFDALNDAGLFLLTGATGAGKTSILDAVCFALYGCVPGVRGVKTLKSQHAEEKTRPEVVLDFSVRDRRFVIRRSPEWSRPKRRGAGVRVETATASLAEMVDGQGHFLTGRAAEVGLAVSSLIGMQAVQFQQVAMLPQGEFQRFLQATSQERHDVLQHLFQTDRFARIEAWVQDRSRSLRDQAAERQQSVQRLLDVMASRTCVELPESFGPEDLAISVGQGTVTTWAEDLLDQAGQRLAYSSEEHRAALAQQTGARTRLDAARLRLRLHDRRAGAVREREALERSRVEVETAQGRLETGAGADACAPVLELLDQASREAETANDLLKKHRRALDATDDRTLLSLDPRSEGSPGSLLAASRSANTLLARVRTILPSARSLVEASAAIDDLEADLGRLLEEQTELTGSMAPLPEARSRLRRQLAQMTADAARREALGLQFDAAVARCAALEALPAARMRGSAAENLVRRARDDAADARDIVQELTERRLVGMAAELAGTLVDGTPCQVCGSTEHPEPALKTADAVTDEEQAVATAAYDRALHTHLVAVEQATTTAEQLASLHEQSGGRDAEDTRATVVGLREQVAAAEAAQAAITGLESKRYDVERALDDGTARLTELTTAVDRLRQQLAARYTAVAEARASVAELLGDGVEPAELPTLEQRLEQSLTRLEQLRSTVDRLHRAEARRDELTDQAERIAARHGFDSLAAVTMAVLTPDVRDRLSRLVSERADALARVSAVLQDAEVTGVDDGPAPDVAAALRASELADAQASSRARGFHQQEKVADELAGLRTQLDEALVAWEPLRESFSRAESMSKLVRGMGSDNQLQMRLSAYVLARRLDQVLDAANERLAQMRDQRYLLQRTDRAARRSGQAGLGLEVVDQWTGDVRGPATLSGGEMFVVSLALALGLADVVTNEAGGTEIETLFVDEGFGSLDADTLDDVMDRIDGLRAGGRTVCVVSHVSELRNRIPHQLHVEKSPRGSSVHLTTLVG
ncbi:SMC family ATPase [soil metagenome]